MLIHRRKPKIERRMNLNLFFKNKRIEMVRQHRIFGVIFDARGKWEAHICDAKARALKKLNIIKSLITHLLEPRPENAPENTPDDHTANHTIWRGGVRISDTQTIRPDTP
jgi:hypothetical protein